MRKPKAHGRRVLVVSHTHPRLTQGGGEIVAFETFRRLNATPGFEGFLLSHDARRLPVRAGAAFTQPFGPREYLYAGRSFDHFLFANPDPNFAQEFEVLLEALQPDIVHFHHFIGIGVEALAMPRRVLPQVRVMLTLHEYLLICHHHGQMVTRPDLTLCEAASPQACHGCFPEQSPPAFFMRDLWLRRHLDGVDLFIAPSHFLRERFRAWGLPAGRMVVQANPLPAPAPPPKRPPSPNNPPRIGFFGQISELKGLGVLFAAARILAARGWPGVIEMHGRQEDQPETLRRRLEPLLAAQPGNVMLCGPYPNAAVAGLMAGCDAVVVPSIWWENAPLVVREAAAAGVRVIGADLGGLGEALRAQPGSILVPPRDPLALAEAILALPQAEPAVAPAPASAPAPAFAPAASIIEADPLNLYRPPPITG